MLRSIIISAFLSGTYLAYAQAALAGGPHGFEPLPAPVTPEQKASVQVSPHATWYGQRVPLAYHPLVQTGTPVGDSAPFALLHDVQGRPIQSADGTPRLCNGLDGATLLQSEGVLYSVVHAECHPGAIQLSRLEQDKQAGTLVARTTEQVDMQSLGGGNLFCAAELTPWGTHLAAEEFEADAGKLQPDGTVSDNHQYYNNMVRYWGDLRGHSPYALGWIDELKITAGKPELQKQYALGRFSHEQARVMPDQRTVYLTDDGTNGGFFVFVADEAGDLSAGKLYMSRWTQQASEHFALAWVDLGHATQAEIAPAIAQPPSFDALFEVSDAQTCPDGFTRIRTSHDKRCLRVRPGKELLASRLESRRFGALRGGTTELRKWEGMAVDPAGRRVFAAVSAVTHGMLAGDPEWDLPSADHIEMAANPCGAVMGMSVAEAPQKDTSGAAIKSEWIVSSAAAVVTGRPVPAQDANGGPQCEIDGIANPDNLAFIPQANALLIAEDTHGHDNNVMWSMDLKTGGLTRVLTAPEGAEVAGLNWFPDIGGFGYLTVTIQFSDPDWSRPDESKPPPMSTSGVIGPFPTRAAAP